MYRGSGHASRHRADAGGSLRLHDAEGGRSGLKTAWAACGSRASHRIGSPRPRVCVRRGAPPRSCCCRSPRASRSAGLVRDPRLDARHRRRHPRRRPVHAGAGAVGVQGRLVAADGPLRARRSGDGGAAGWRSRRSRCSRARPDARRRRRSSGRDLGGRRARAGDRVRLGVAGHRRTTPTRSTCCGRTNRASRSARGPRCIARRWRLPAALRSRSPAVRLAGGQRAAGAALRADAVRHVEGARTGRAAVAARARSATRCGSRSSAFSPATARSRSSRSSCSTSSPTSSRRR